MKNSKNIVSVSILLALSILGVSAQAQRQASRTTDRQAGVILQRIEQASSRFHNSLNAALARGRMDQTQPQNDINTFQADFENATSQFRDQLTRRRANTTDVQNVLQKASLVNSFMARNRLNSRARTDWASIRTDLNSLATVNELNQLRRLMEVVRHGRVDLTPLLTHTFPLDRIKEAHDLFGSRAEGVLKVAIKP